MGKTERRSLGAAAADFNQDGHLDLFVACDLGYNLLYQNRGDGTFEEVAAQSNVTSSPIGKVQANMGVAVGDYDGDGDLDILVTTFADEPFTLYRNEGGYYTDATVEAGIFQPTLPFLGFGCGFVDTRNQGVLDLFFADGHVSPYTTPKAPDCGYKQRNLLLLNDGKGHFSEDKPALPPDDIRVHRGACFGDINNDGRVDILVTAGDDRPTLLRNDSAAGNWLLLRLTNKHGCATPVGTRCVATVGGKKLLRVVLGGGSYGGDSDMRVHFGLGDGGQDRRAGDHLAVGRKADVPRHSRQPDPHAARGASLARPVCQDRSTRQPRMNTRVTYQALTPNPSPKLGRGEL